MYRIHQKSNNTIVLLQGDPGAAGLGGLPGLPGEDGAPGQKVNCIMPTLWKTFTLFPNFLVVSELYLPSLCPLVYNENNTGLFPELELIVTSEDCFIVSSTFPLVGGGWFTWFKRS